MKTKLFLTTLCAAGLATLAGNPVKPAISGDYLEVRSCDVFTGHCFANGEMGLTGKEGILVWKVREGAWQNVALDGLTVIAVVRADGTLGDVQHEPRKTDAVLVVDSKATAAQQRALEQFAIAMSGGLIHRVAGVKLAPIDASFGACTASGCASIKAGKLVEISTRCLGDKDHICGSEELYYPPLTEVEGARAAFSELAAYRGNTLNLTWETVGNRGAYLARFSR